MFQSTYLVQRKDLTHLPMQIEKSLAKQNYYGWVGKFHFILAAQNFDGSIHAKIVHELID